jgi:hypothetical protein
MTDYEITFITHLLGVDAGKEIITIAYEDKAIKSRSGFLYKPARLVTDVLNEDAEGLIICGGWYGDTRHELIQLINDVRSQRFFGQNAKHYITSFAESKRSGIG